MNTRRALQLPLPPMFPRKPSAKRLLVLLSRVLFPYYSKLPLQMVETAEKEFGKLNILFNNAGVMLSEDGCVPYT